MGGGTPKGKKTESDLEKSGVGVSRRWKGERWLKGIGGKGHRDRRVQANPARSTQQFLGKKEGENETKPEGSGEC